MESVFAGAFAMLIGMVGVWTGLRALKNRAALDRWPTTTGRVLCCNSRVLSGDHGFGSILLEVIIGTVTSTLLGFTLLIPQRGSRI